MKQNVKCEKAGVPIWIRRLLCLAMVIMAANLPIFTANVRAEGVVLVDGLKYELNYEKRTANVAEKNTVSQKVLEIPHVIEYEGIEFHVTGILTEAFSGCTNLEEVIIPQGVSFLGGYVFYSCTSLNKVIIPEGVTSIGGGTFYKCISLKNIELPDSVGRIEDYVFYGCTNLETVKVSPEVVSIGSHAFSGCVNLKNFTIPNEVYRIDVYAFENCKSLTSVTIPYRVERIRDYAFLNCTNIKSVTIPEGVVWIGKGVFMGCTSLNSIFIPESVSRLEAEAFSGCVSLTSVNIPCKISKIEDNLFSSCTGLKRVTIPSNITTIGKGAFWDCKSLDGMSIPANVTDIQSGAFMNCTSLSGIQIPNSVSEIEDATFSGCTNLKNVIIPEGIERIGKMAFQNCSNLEQIQIPNSVEWIELYAFEACGKLSEVTIPENVICVSTKPFKDCDETKLVLHVACTKNLREVRQWGSYKELIYEHKGGTATCQNKAKCSSCGEEYGELEDHMFTSTWMMDETNHWYECSVCKMKKDVTAHNGGEATCEKQAICSDCGKAYGELTEHTLQTTVTKATTTANGKKETKCSVCNTVTETKTIYAANTVKLSKTAYIYDGKSKKPSVTVKDSKGKSIANTNYSVKYDDGRKNVGKYNVKITFKGDYKGSKTLSFTINPKATTLKSVTPASKAFTATWSKQTTQVDGYEIQYALDEKFTSSAKKNAVTKNTTTSKKISNLKSKKTYYVRVRTYKKVDTKKYYSDWSQVLKVKTK